jgi:hypothetical protein
VEKLVYLLHKAETAPVPATFTAQFIHDVIPRLKAAGARNILFTPCDLNEQMRAAAPARLMGNWESLAGAVHFWLDTLDTRTTIEPLLRAVAPTISGYLVTESVVQQAKRTWRDGERRPGVTQLAVITKAPGISDDEFYHNWQTLHSPFSFRLHPLRTEYVRNAVARVLTPGAAPYRIIVLEQWQELRDFTDDARYFGSPEVVREMHAEAPYGDFAGMLVGPTSEYAFA